MPLPNNTILHDRYRIETLLGAGGMGAVYRARDENLGIEVALKENLEPQPGGAAAATDPSTTAELTAVREQFRREAQLLAQLRHPGLPKVTDHFIIPGQGQYLVMDFIAGSDLQALLQQTGALREARVVEIGLELCDILEYLHGQSPPVIHRDIKPANVRLDAQGRVVLVDFGVAKEAWSGPTRTAARAVSAGYSPLEQYSGQGKTDARSDIYALGAMLYALVTGQAPPSSTDRTLGAPLPIPRSGETGATERLQRVLEKAIELRPEDRYQSVGEFRQALLDAGRTAAKPTVAPSLPPVRETRYASEAEAAGGRAPKETRPVGPVRGQVESPPDRGPSGGGPSVPRWLWVMAGVVVLGVAGGLIVRDQQARERTQAMARAQARQTAVADSIRQVKAAEQAQRERERAATGSIVIRIAPTGLPAPWRLTGPDGYQREGQGATVLDGRQAGAYRLTWLAVDGRQTPRPGTQSQPLTAGSELTFTGQYAEAEPAPPALSAGTRREWVIAGQRFVFRWIPPGEGLIGSPESEPCRRDDETQFTAVFPRGFWLQQTEVTQEQWAAVMGDNPSRIECRNCPVEQVSWDHVQQFLQRLNSQDLGRYRLPTEAEWEYAGRAGSAEPFGATCHDYGAANCTDEVPCLNQLGWYQHNSARKEHPVGAMLPNSWGLYDMIGNVSEWVSDFYGPYPVGHVVDPHGPMHGSLHVRRGGSWFHVARWQRLASRVGEEESKSGRIGFRCVRSPD